MTRLVRRGLYESLLTQALADLLQQIPADLRTIEPLRAADAADRLGLHIGHAVRSALEDLSETDRVNRGVEIANELLQQLAAVAPETASRISASVLRAIVARRPDGSPEAIPSPLIPLLDTALLTNSPGEPRVGSQVLAEIHSADRIDVVMAFIRRSGIAPLVDALRRHCEAPRKLRVLTTTYTGSTEKSALDLLQALGAEVRVSYDTTGTRLHAKSWLFHRESGFSTAYIGSSNLTHSALVTGLEWNVRISGARNPDVISKVSAVFETSWNSPDFVPYDPQVFAEQTTVADTGGAFILSPIELRPEPFQERLLEQIELARQQGRHRNLLVSATGTGKTVMAAVDYARLRERLPRARLLFVAHRKEILEQSLRTFRHALRSHSFGELWVDGRRPSAYEHVFASIQSLNALDSRASTRRTSTLSSSTSSTTRRRSRTRRFSARSRRWSCSGSRPRRNAATACRSSTCSMAASPRSCGSGTRSTSSGSRRSRTSASTMGWTCGKCRGGGAGDMTSRA